MPSIQPIVFLDFHELANKEILKERTIGQSANEIYGSHTPADGAFWMVTRPFMVKTVALKTAEAGDDDLAALLMKKFDQEFELVAVPVLARTVSMSLMAAT